MLIIRKNDGFSVLQLERLLNKSGAYGVWEYHCAASSSMFSGFQAGRHAALLPAEPKEGQEVEAFVMLRPNSPQEEWKPIGKGVAQYR